MAANQIPVDINSPWGRQYLRFRNLLLEVRNLGDEVRGKAIACLDGSDYSRLEAQFGLQAGDGQSAFAELDTVYQALFASGSVDNVDGKCQQFIDFVG